MGNGAFRSESDEAAKPVSRSALVLILALIAAAIALAIVVGTVYALARGTRATASGTGTDRSSRTAYYSSLGEIRSVTADPSRAVVVVRISLPYDSGDIAFAEELRKKRGELHDAAVAYFGSKTVLQLHPSKEAEVKRELKEAFNARLILGKLDEILLTDFAIIP